MGTRTVSQTINLSARSEPVSKYITKIDENGIWVTPSGKKPTNINTGAGATGTKITGIGMEIFKDGISIAQYGDIVRIGKELENHLNISSTGLSLGKANVKSFQISNSGKIGTINDSVGESQSGSINQGESIVITVDELSTLITGQIFDFYIIPTNLSSLLFSNYTLPSFTKGTSGTAYVTANFRRPLVGSTTIKNIFQIIYNATNNNFTVTAPICDDPDLQNLLDSVSYQFLGCNYSVETDLPIITIGPSTGGVSYAQIDYHALKLVDRNNKPYFWVSDLRDVNNKVSVSENFTILEDAENPGSPDINTYYLLKGAIASISDIVEVKNNGIIISNWEASEQSTGMCIRLTSDEGISIGDIITVIFYDSDNNFKALTFGTRQYPDYITTPGPYSIAMGKDVIADGYHSFATGYATQAYGDTSHSEGLNTIARGFASHAEGEETEARGVCSHTSGLSTIAVADYQTVVGKYNQEDEDALFIIGNGKDNINRSNLMVVGNNYIRIGNTYDSHLELDYHSLQITDKEGNPFLNVKDLRNEEGEAEITVTFVTDGMAKAYSLIPNAKDTNYKVIVNNVEITNFYQKTTSSFVLANEPADGTLITATYTTTEPGARAFTFGSRNSNGTIGISSAIFGNECIASGTYAFALGNSNTARGKDSLAGGLRAIANGNESFSFGLDTITNADNSCAMGYSNTTNSNAVCSFAFGGELTTKYPFQTVIGRRNKSNAQDLFEVGNGWWSGSFESNALELTYNGKLTIASTLTQNSDQRLKKHISYLNNEAIDFIEELKPAYYIKDKEKHLGFYAQDVEKIDKWDCMVGEMNGYKTLGYTEIIAPLVTYCQHLKKEIQQLKKEIQEFNK